MKPRTKLQKKAADLAQTLPELTERQKRWGYRIIKPVAFYTSKRVWCTECGHVEYGDFDTLASTTGQFLCPNCGSLLELKQSKKKSARGAFVGLAFDDGRVFCHVLRDVQEFYEEGKKMHHCVYANEYFNVKEHPDSLILSARDKDGKRLETVEVNTKKWKVIQSRGLQNHKTAYHGEIIALMGKYMPMMIKAQQNANSDKITL